MDQQLTQPQTILAIGAHPDDVEFGCGGTMAKLSAAGATVYFLVCTDGQRGSRHHQVEKQALVLNRKQEATNAASILGAAEVYFLDEEDGNLQADIHLKEKIARYVRKLKPDVIFTHDPTWFFGFNEDGTAFVNHTDHRACGSAVLDVVYPLARDLQSFPHHIDEGLEPHIVPELYFYHVDTPNEVVEITGTFADKIQAIAAHASQIDDLEGVRERMEARARKLGTQHGMTLAEGFTRLRFSR